MEEQKQGYLDLTRRGNSNDITHHPIIQVFTAGRGWVSVVRATDSDRHDHDRADHGGYARS